MGEDAYKRIFSKNLRRVMSQQDKTQIDLINDLGFNKSAVSTWVNGTRLPRMDKVQQLADYFGCLRSDLIEDQSEPDTPDLTLSPDEEKHIRNYRALDEADRIKVDGYMDGILDGEKYKRGRSGIA